MRVGTQVLGQTALGMWEQGQGQLWFSPVPIYSVGLGESLLISSEAAGGVLPMKQPFSPRPEAWG